MISYLDTHKDLLQSHVWYMYSTDRTMFAEQHFDQCMFGLAKHTDYGTILSPSHIT